MKTCNPLVRGNGLLFPTVFALALLCQPSPAEAAVSVTFEQARNGALGNLAPLATFGYGSVSLSTGHYLEGHSVPYRLVLTNLGVGAHSATIEWDVRYGGRSALDYITHFNRLEPHTKPVFHPAETVNPLIGLSGTFGTPNTFPIPAPNFLYYTGQPTLSFNALPASERTMTIYNGSVTNLFYVFQGIPMADSAARMGIQFLANASTVVIAWGGHIARSLDYGPESTACGLPGSPYNMRLIDLDGQSQGNRQLSLYADAVYTSDICGPTTVCTGATNSYTMSSEYNPASYLWSLVTNTAGATLLAGPYPNTAKVAAGLGGGAYTLRANASGILCETTVNVIPQPAAPLLNIARIDTNAVFSWCVCYSNLVLEVATNLPAGASWTAVPGTPFVIGDQFVVTNTLGTGTKFFRLRGL